ncbi:MAG: ATP phosphoribosyltransferase, partial [Bacteroidales bacterium]|nr:ATP phosphoribosyltransferase [Bacteroidales bacterium]
MIRIAIQSKGRLSEDSLALMREAGIKIDELKRKFLARAAGFPLEVLYLRDDDIPGVVAGGSADLGIVGLNEVVETGAKVRIVRKMGFGACRLSLAIPKDQEYTGPQFFAGKRIATSYPNVLSGWLAANGVTADIRKIMGS